ncbi:MAG: preprotein translocase subunit SecE [Chlamydiae bacterium RIFCSPHIGHO2_12_FULL_27_8]|nr:MAG: preprotein translocase subunit SecE [Chlamydiae bacterium RIFCSPHIGHO2_12_FULL_27_8]OGN65388.1 MAG: preprotein translocase subunit SecE [Chlamydiae bacterium RIFCSPLOWO2_01_FULL_28_7]
MDTKVVEVNFKENKESYFKELKTEFKKISWTSKIELFAFTKIVLISTFLFSFLIYFSDVAIRGFLTLINIVSKLIFG